MTMPKGLAAGLKKYGQATPTSDITKDLESHSEIDNPGALAAWVRRKGLGMNKSEFAKYGAAQKRAGK